MHLVQVRCRRSRLHSGQDLGDLTFVDITDYTLRAMPLDVVLNQFVILKDGNLGFLGSRGND